jgi:hypothetical protein
LSAPPALHCRNYRNGRGGGKGAGPRLSGFTFSAGIDPAPCSVREGKDAHNRRQAMDDRIVKSPQEASQGQKPGVTRYVLTVGLVLVVILFLVAYLISV